MKQQITSLFFVRHGQTEWNTLRKIQGHADIPLSEIGIAQAKVVAQLLASHRFDAIISSDLQRAVQTATIINEYHKHDIQLEPLLREQHYGVAQGLMGHEVLHQFCVVEDKPFGQPEPEYSVPQAESYVQLVDRTHRALQLILNVYAGQSVLVVAHSSFIRSLIRYALQNHRVSVEIENCGIAQFQHDTQLVFTGFMGEGGRLE